MQNKAFINIVRWIVILTIPFLLTLGVVRLLVSWDSPSYPEFEYVRIDPDPYGFTLEERLAYADATLGYLRRPEPAEEVIYLLEDLRLPDGEQPLYNAREIGHMIDVKLVADAFLRVFWVLLAIAALGLIFLFARGETRSTGANALMRGGFLTVIIVLLVMVFLAVAWSLAFTLFHNILFPPGTWTFSYSDSLIRLFPEQFWFDFGILWTGLILVSGLVLGAIGYGLGKRWS